MNKIKEHLGKVYEGNIKNGKLSFYGYLEGSRAKILIEPIRGEFNKKKQQAYKLYIER